MATSIVTQPVIASPLGKTRFTASSFPSKHVPSQCRSARMQVKCKAEVSHPLVCRRSLLSLLCLNIELLMN